MFFFFKISTPPPYFTRKPHQFLQLRWPLMHQYNFLNYLQFVTIYWLINAHKSVTINSDLLILGEWGGCFLKVWFHIFLFLTTSLIDSSKIMKFILFFNVILSDMLIITAEMKTEFLGFERFTQILFSFLLLRWLLASIQFHASLRWIRKY